MDFILLMLLPGKLVELKNENNLAFKQDLYLDGSDGSREYPPSYDDILKWAQEVNPVDVMAHFSPDLERMMQRSKQWEREAMEAMLSEESDEDTDFVN
jgi:hypothetical protein